MAGHPVGQDGVIESGPRSGYTDVHEDDAGHATGGRHQSVHVGRRDRTIGAQFHYQHLAQERSGAIGLNYGDARRELATD